jgi:rhodanese-related sulfurtransferase
MGTLEGRMPNVVDRWQVQALVRDGAQLVEVLPHQEFEEEHLPEAINLPLRRIEKQALGVLDPTRPVVVYCFDSA